MKKLFFLFIISHLFCSSKPTIVLIHGFMGWGREEMGNYYYWGGFTDLQEYLRSEGYNVHTISVGPISSNWDRAIELFATSAKQSNILKELGQDNEMDIVVKDGRYGIYVTNGKVNVTLPKDLDYNSLDLNTALDLISKKKPKKKFAKN